MNVRYKPHAKLHNNCQAIDLLVIYFSLLVKFPSIKSVFRRNTLILQDIIYGIDKYKAKKGKGRISEATLLLMAVIGGSMGRFAALAIRLCDLIEGWIIAMQQMCVGDKWEVYIPAEMGYGKFSQPGIPGGSTLIFEIELLGIA